MIWISRCSGQCFNEAEAIKPRNLPIRLTAESTPTSFNEAEAIKPRNREREEVVRHAQEKLQ